MRFLKRDSNGTVSLTRDMPEADAFELKYAILSHAWDDELDDISYDDIVRGELDKSGYKRIQFCIDHASRDGLHYFWIDSCCIDRRSLAESGASILAMYRYYANAQKCYVYLSDTGNLQESRWLSRDRTVLELLASTIIEFFWQGECIGSKVSMEDSISKSTGVPVAALRGKALLDYSVQERKKWCLGPTATISADRVYFSLSLLGVAMTIIRGEGPEAAQDRLECALKSKYRDQSILPEHTSRSVEVTRTGYERSLKIKETYLGQSHMSTLETVHNLGALCRLQERYEEAEDMLHRSLKLREDSLGPEHLSTIESAHELGWVYTTQEKFAKAEKLLLRALSVRQERLGINDNATLATVTLLGRNYRTMQNLSQAEHHLQRSYKAHRDIYGSRHTATMSALLDIGLLYSTQWKFDEAETACREVVMVYKEELGPDAKATLSAMSVLGSILYTQSYVIKAKNLFRPMSKQIGKNTLEEESKTKAEEGEALLRKVAKACEQDNYPGSYHGNTTRGHLGHSMINSKDSHIADEGARLCRAALAKQEMIVGPLHSTTLVMKLDLAGYQRDHGSLKEAECEYLRCLDEHIAHLGPNHTATTRVRFNLAQLYKRQNRPEAREETLAQALRAGEALFGLQHWYVMIAVSSLFFAYRQNGKNNEARELFHRVDAGYKTATTQVQALLDTLRAVLPRKMSTKEKQSSTSIWKRIFPGCWSSKSDDPPAYSEKAIAG